MNLAAAKVALVVALVAGASCIDTSGPKDVVCTDTESLAVTVTPGLTPRIAWTPECTAFLLLVYDSAALDDQILQWAVLSIDTISSQVPPSVLYGTLPSPNTMEFAPARLLQAGRAYQVFVAIRGGIVFGDAYFTP